MNESASILILFAHPDRSQSRVQRTLLKAVKGLENVSIVDLYEEYPDFLIDVEREQERLVQHRLLVFQHPLYWYSCPPLLKEWMDCVLQKGWAYGEGGDKLKGLDFLQVLSSGGPEEAYNRSGYNRFTIPELLRPIEATAVLCGWNYHRPFMVQGVRDMDQLRLEEYGREYRDLLRRYLLQGSAVLERLDTTGNDWERPVHP